MKKKPEYRIRVSTPGISTTLEGVEFYTPARGRKKRSLSLVRPQTSEVSNKEVEELLKGLLVAFENAATRHYCVKKAKTSIVTTTNAEGKLEVSLGMNIFKLIDAAGNVKGERTEGIEIDIERIERPQ